MSPILIVASMFLSVAFLTAGDEPPMTVEERKDWNAHPLRNAECVFAPDGSKTNAPCMDLRKPAHKLHGFPRYKNLAADNPAPEYKLIQHSTVSETEVVCYEVVGEYAQGCVRGPGGPAPVIYATYGHSAVVEHEVGHIIEERSKLPESPKQ